MAHLNLFYKKKILFKSLLTILVGKLFFISTLDADVVSFYDPLETKSINFELFLANDPVSLEELFSGWSTTFDPKDGKNIALGDLRFDIGADLDRFHIGYFYRYNIFIKTQKDFTTLYYNSKNKIEYEEKKRYNLDLYIDGIKESGILVSSSKRVIDDLKNSLDIGLSFFIVYGVDMQDGTIDGYASIPKPKEYDISAQSSYYYTHNYLYDLSVDDSKGYGYGSDFSLYYNNHDNEYSIKFIVNDLFSYMYWKDLPYSYVDIKTENKSYDKDGFLKYSPSISGVEKYKDYRQKIKPRLKLETTKKIYDDTLLSFGLIRAYYENFPYVKVVKNFSDIKKLEFSYESRFNSFGIDFKYKDFSVGIEMDKIYDFSVFGLRSSYRF